MKNVFLMIGMLSVLLLVNGCGSENEIAEEAAVDAPAENVTEAEVAAEEVEAVIEETPEKAEAEMEAVEEAPEKAEAEMEAVEEAAEKAEAEMEAEEAAEKAETEMEVEEAAAKPDTEATAAEAAPEAVDPDAVAVTVNGQTITEKEISEEVEKMTKMQKKGMPPGMQLPDSIMQQMRKRVVDMKIEQVLLSQGMEKNNIPAVTDEQVIEEIKKIAGQRDQSLEDVEAEIAKMGMTLEDVKGQIRSQMQKKALMESQTPDAVVTDADAQKFYDENPQHFENKKQQVRASHILCGKRGIKEEEYPAELEKIQAAQARLEAGEAFEDVAKECSSCPSSANGGDLNFFGKGQMDPAFEKAAFEMEVGQTSGIVKTSFGYHIIKLTDKKEPGKVPFEEVKDKITQFLNQQKQRTFWGEYKKTMFDNATIEYSEKEKALQEEAKKAQQAAMQQQMMQQMAAQQKAVQQPDEAKAAAEE